MKTDNHMAVLRFNLLGRSQVGTRKAMHKVIWVSQPGIADLIGTWRQVVTVHIDGFREYPKIQAAIAAIWQVRALTHCLGG